MLLIVTTLKPEAVTGELDVVLPPVSGGVGSAVIGWGLAFARLLRLLAVEASESAPSPAGTLGGIVWPGISASNMDCAAFLACSVTFGPA